MKRRRVLIVDDREDNALSLAAILSSVGYETSVATGGRAALDIVDTERPDAVALDLWLPDLSGYEVCRQLRAQRGATVS